MSIFFGGPVVNEIVVNIPYFLNCRRVLKPEYADKYKVDDHYNIIYSQGYNYNSLGFDEQIHYVDTKRSHRVFKFLNRFGTIPEDAKIIEPTVCPRELLLRCTKWNELLKNSYAFYL